MNNGRTNVLVDGRIFFLQNKGGISQFWSNVLASTHWQDKFNIVLLGYPGFDNNIHLKETGLLSDSSKIQLVLSPIPPSDVEQYAHTKYNTQRAALIRRLGFKFSAVINTYYGENIYPNHGRYIVTALDFAHEELTELARKPSTPWILNRKRTAFTQADWISFISNFSRERSFVHYPQIERNKTGVIYLGHGPINTVAPRSRNTILHIGNRSGYKNFSIVAEGVSEIMAHHPTVRFMVLGGESTDLNVEKLINRFPGRVIFDPSPTDKAVDLAMAVSWIYVSGSLYEGFGLPLLNAMRLGTHPLVSDIPVYREIGGERAHYFDPLSPHSLSQYLEILLSNTPHKSQVYRPWDDVAIEYARLICNE